MPSALVGPRGLRPGGSRPIRTCATLLAAGLALLVAGADPAAQRAGVGASATAPVTTVDVPLRPFADRGVRDRITTVSADSTPAAPVTAPLGLQATITGPVVSLTWMPPASGVPDSYRLDAGSAAGASDLASVPLPGTQTSLTTPAPDGVYYLRVRAISQGMISQPSNEVTAVVGCSGPPAPPTFTASQGPGGTPIHFTWTRPAGSVTGYRLEAGTASGLADLAVVPIAATTMAFDTPAPLGTYYVRLRAVNACGQSPPSAELVIVVGQPCVAPGAPLNLMASVSGTIVSLTWSAPATGSAPIRYTLVAGSAPGAADLGRFPLGPATSFQASVPIGTYYVRVEASNDCQTSVPSNEVTIAVGVGAPILTFTITPNPVPLTGVFAGCDGSVVPFKTWVYHATITNTGTAPFTLASWNTRVTSPLLSSPVDIPTDAAGFAQIFGSATIPPQGSVQSPLCVTGQFDGAALDWRFVDVQGRTYLAPRIHILPAGF